MDILDIILIIIIFAVYFITKKKFKKPQEEAPQDTKIKNYPYKKKLLLTKTEYSFYNTLKPLCDNANLIICPKIRMEDFLEVTDKQNYMKFRGYIKSRHIDFMLCNNNLHILAGIELDDKSHNLEKAKQTDEFKNQVFKTINIPLYRIKVSNGTYNDQLIKIINELDPTKALPTTNKTISAKEIIPAKEISPNKNKTTSNYLNIP